MLYAICFVICDTNCSHVLPSIVLTNHQNESQFLSTTSSDNVHKEKKWMKETNFRLQISSSNGLVSVEIGWFHHLASIFETPLHKIWRKWRKKTNSQSNILQLQVSVSEKFYFLSFAFIPIPFFVFIILFRPSRFQPPLRWFAIVFNIERNQHIDSIFQGINLDCCTRICELK